MQLHYVIFASIVIHHTRSSVQTDSLRNNPRYMLNAKRQHLAHLPSTRQKASDAMYGSIQEHVIPSFAVSDPGEFTYPDQVASLGDIRPDVGPDETLAPGYQRYAYNGVEGEGGGAAFGQQQELLAGGFEKPEGSEGAGQDDAVYMSSPHSIMGMDQYTSDQEPGTEQEQFSDFSDNNEENIYYRPPPSADMPGESTAYNAPFYPSNDVTSKYIIEHEGMGARVSPWRQHVYDLQPRLPPAILKKYLKRLIEQVGPTLSWKQAIAAFRPRPQSGGMRPQNGSRGTSAVGGSEKPSGISHEQIRKLMQSKVKTAELTSDLTAEAKNLVNILHKFRQRLQHNALLEKARPKTKIQTSASKVRAGVKIKQSDAYRQQTDLKKVADVLKSI
ncbi:uncharacterized protein LOC116615988 [Nematostella vectensis]|uniref:uncharacterized protein LOC116615988 n=1 Tax=Nematostella vectensis TaxID=45351 RepID=UPI00138FF876|nr:uncharacterized protein LOC116615988 [Nematostella vectensis]